MKLASLSVDLDEVHHYFDIHGLPRPALSTKEAEAAYTIALDRIASFARASAIPVTFFAVGEDLARPASAAALAAIAAEGHPVENHTQHHRYDLTRLDRDTITREIEDGSRSIARVTGRAPVGFRAPGYTINDAVLDALIALGVRFDSSVFPCPPYYAAKALAMAAMRARGRSSRSILDTPLVLTAPSRPYKPGRSWRSRGGRPIVELPIQVTPGLRLPVIGTSIGLAGPLGARALAAMCASEPLVNIELHAMDFLDRGDGLDALAARQPELGTPLARRTDALGAMVDALRGRGFAFVTLEEAASSCA